MTQPLDYENRGPQPDGDDSRREREAEIATAHVDYVLKPLLQNALHQARCEYRMYTHADREPCEKLDDLENWIETNIGE